MKLKYSIFCCLAATLAAVAMVHMATANMKCEKELRIIRLARLQKMAGEVQTAVASNEKRAEELLSEISHPKIRPDVFFKITVREEKTFGKKGEAVFENVVEVERSDGWKMNISTEELEVLHKKFK